MIPFLSGPLYVTRGTTEGVGELPSDGRPDPVDEFEGEVLLFSVDRPLRISDIDMSGGGRAAAREAKRFLSDICGGSFSAAAGIPILGPATNGGGGGASGGGGDGVGGGESERGVTGRMEEGSPIRRGREIPAREFGRAMGAEVSASGATPATYGGGVGARGGRGSSEIGEIDIDGVVVDSAGCGGSGGRGGTTFDRVGVSSESESRNLDWGCPFLMGNGSRVSKVAETAPDRLDGRENMKSFVGGDDGATGESFRLENGSKGEERVAVNSESKEMVDDSIDVMALSTLSAVVE